MLISAEIKYKKTKMYTKAKQVHNSMNSQMKALEKN